MAKKFTNQQWEDVADFIKAELARRQEKRRDLEKIWASIDRQIAMIPQPRKIESGKETDWFPNTELPWQFDALEVIAADARRLKFPRGTQWYKASSNLSDKYLERYEGRTGFSIIGEKMVDLPTGPEAVRPPMNQEMADTLVKSVVDHYHRLYDFRTQIDLLDAEGIKYGTFVGRVRPVVSAKFSYEFRGMTDKKVIGPAVIACSVKNTYLDDTLTATMHEGVATSPSIIRTQTRHLDSLKRAAKKGGPEKGWLLSQIKQLEQLKPADDDGRKGFVDMIEYEGDLSVPQSRGSIFLPNVLITVAVRAGMARPVRFRENSVPFQSYAVGHYMRDNVRSPYGASPLMKGAPIQESASLVFNQMQAVAAFHGQPATVYDRHETEFAANQGPDLYPGASFAADSKEAIEILKIGDLPALMQVYLTLRKEYEDLTGVNDPRRGAAIKSHTTRGGAELEASRGIARTVDFVVGEELGPITSILNMEYAIIKDVMKSPQPISVGAGGIEGWVNIASADLPDNVLFTVQGSAGAISEREQSQDFLAAVNFGLQVAQAALVVGVKVPLKFQEIIIEGFEKAGVQNASRFVGPPEDIPGFTPGRPGVPGANGGLQAPSSPLLAP